MEWSGRQPHHSIGSARAIDEAAIRLHPEPQPNGGLRIQTSVTLNSAKRQLLAIATIRRRSQVDPKPVGQAFEKQTFNVEFIGAARAAAIVDRTARRESA
jgi:hypothetical protein